MVAPAMAIGRCAQQIGIKNNAPANMDALSGGLVILARVKPSPETDFAQILLPVALSYDTFVCKLCVALGVERTAVKKVLKLPDILIRSTEDVVRLEQWDKLELRVVRPSLVAASAEKFKHAGWWMIQTLLWIVLLFTLFAVCQQQQVVNQQLSGIQSHLTHLENSAKIAAQAKETSLQPSAVCNGHSSLVDKLHSMAKDQKTLIEAVVHRMEIVQRTVEGLTDKVKDMSRGLSAIKSAIYD